MSLSSKLSIIRNNYLPHIHYELIANGQRMSTTGHEETNLLPLTYDLPTYSRIN